MKNVLIILILSILILSCKSNDTEEKLIIKERVILDKTIEEIGGTAFDRGYVNYLLAFTDGYTEDVSFGYYTCLKKGDTVTFQKKENDWSWKLKVKCE